MAAPADGGTPPTRERAGEAGGLYPCRRSLPTEDTGREHSVGPSDDKEETTMTKADSNGDTLTIETQDGARFTVPWVVLEEAQARDERDVAAARELLEGDGIAADGDVVVFHLEADVLDRYLPSASASGATPAGGKESDASGYGSYALAAGTSLVCRAIDGGGPLNVSSPNFGRTMRCYFVPTSRIVEKGPRLFP
jgi:hypothetical protein